MRAEDETPHQLFGLVCVEAGERSGAGGVQGDEVGLLARLQRTDRAIQPERPRAVKGPEAKPVERTERRARLALGDQRALRVRPGAHHREDRELPPARDVAAPPPTGARLPIPG